MAYFNGKKTLSVDLITKVPTAQLEITENGEYNVMQYGSVDVDVPTGGGATDNVSITTIAPILTLKPNSPIVTVKEQQQQYQVSFSIEQYSEGSKSLLKLYDGQDNTAPLLYDWTNTSGTITQTVTCTSGYLYLEYEGGAIVPGLTSSTPNITTEDGYDDVTGTNYTLCVVNGDGSITGFIEFDD